MRLLSALLEEGLLNPKPFGPAEVRNEVWIAIRNDGASGSGTFEDPYNGATHTLLDGLLRNVNLINTNATIRFGPGIFQTKGFAENVATFGFAVRSGQKFVGSGMNQTTLQLVNVAPLNKELRVVAAVFGSTDAVNDVEISDMTLDCNSMRQPQGPLEPSDLNFHKLRLQGIDFRGAANLRIHRVRVINWSTLTRLDPDENKTAECFPIFATNLPAIQGEGPGELVVDSCIVDQPGTSPARESTCINCHVDPNTNLAPPLNFPNLDRLYYATIRNCYLDGDCTTGSPPPPEEVRRITYSSGVMTVQTRWPHRVQANDKVVITGSSVPEYNGRFSAATADDFNSFTIALAGLPSAPTNSGITVQRYVPEAMLIASISYASGTATVTCRKAHGRRTGDWVRISGTEVTSAGVDKEFYNGSFACTPHSTDLEKFTYQIEDPCDEWITFHFDSDDWETPNAAVPSHIRKEASFL